MCLAPVIAIPGRAGALRATTRTVRPEPTDPDRRNRRWHWILLDRRPEIPFHALGGISRVHGHMLDLSNRCLTDGGLGLARQLIDRRLGLFNGVLRHILGGFSGLLSDFGGSRNGLLRDLGGGADRLLRESFRIKPLLDCLDR